MQAGILSVFAQYERELIGQRTKEALAVKRAQGVRLGRPPAVSIDVRAASATIATPTRACAASLRR
jgi:DNA invertase Pin-like site-specific DNA recombinase